VGYVVQAVTKEDFGADVTVLAQTMTESELDAFALYARNWTFSYPVCELSKRTKKKKGNEESRKKRSERKNRKKGKDRENKKRRGK